MRISSFFVLAGYLAANAYVAARTSVFLHRNLPERVAKLISLLTAGVYSVFAMGMPLAHILPEGTARKLILRVSFGFYGIFIYLFSAYVIIEVLARLSKRFHRTERLTARKGNPKRRCVVRHHPDLPDGDSPRIRADGEALRCADR